MEIVASTSSRLLELLELYNISQAELARRTGLQRSTISRYISGQREMLLDKAKIIANAFNVNPAWLMGFDVDIEPFDSNAVMKTYLDTVKGHALIKINEYAENMDEDQLKRLMEYAEFLMTRERT